MSNALQGLATGNRKNKPAKREQTVLTPHCIAAFMDHLWGAITLDPCYAEGQVVEPVRGYDLKAGCDGLARPWADRTYCNPPFNALKKWLNKAREEATRHGAAQRIAVLCPVRSRSGWWRSARDHARDAGYVVELNRLAFHGFKGSHPESMCLFLFNEPSTRTRIRALVGDLGSVLV